MIRRPDPGHGQRIVALVLLISLSALLPACINRSTPRPAPADAPAKSAELARAIRPADRIEVRSSIDPAEPLIVATSGRDVAEDFLTSVPIDDLGGEFRCPCPGTLVVRFFRGEDLLATLTVHHFRSIRWIDGPWQSDAFLAGMAGATFPQWIFRHGGSFAGVSQPVPTAPPQVAPPPADFFSHFPAEARALFPASFGWTEGLVPRRVASDLPGVMPDPTTRAGACFRALGGDTSSWFAEDAKVGLAQNAVVELDDAALLAALEAATTDEQALRGAARVYFRFKLNERFDTATNAIWLPRLADTALRTGSPANRSHVLIHVAETRDPAAFAFLAEIARGVRTYPWEQSCLPPTNGSVEPSLVASAAVLLALSGDADAVRLATGAQDPVFGLDAAAADIARTLVTPSHPVRPSHFKYPSSILGYTAAEALAKLPPTEVSIAVLQRALDHASPWVGRRARAVAAAASLSRAHETGMVDLFSAPVSQILVADHPALALEQCNTYLATLTGRDRTALLVLRGAIHERRGDTAAAIADLEEALLARNYSPLTLHRRLAWLYWHEGRLEEALPHIQQALREQPDAEMLMLRGLTRYAGDDHGPATELDFTAALTLDPTNGYARILQHLTACLGGRPGASHLHTAPADDLPSETRLTLNLGTMNLTVSDGHTPPWQTTLVAYLQGALDEDALLGTASGADPGNPSVERTEAYFYMAQKARISGDRLREETLLRKCVDEPMPQVAEYQVARRRLRTLSTPDGPDGPDTSAADTDPDRSPDPGESAASR